MLIAKIHCGCLLGDPVRAENLGISGENEEKVEKLTD
jgi:hypothetical protein